jgi:DSF synthase
MGLPEILFNSFPGMGAYSFLSRRIGPARAERMMLSGEIYTAAQIYEMGVVDLVVDDGQAEQAVRDYITADKRSHAVRHALYRIRQRVNPVTLAELRDVTDIWVDTALKLSPSDLRRMRHLQAAQSRRLSKSQ